MAKLVEFEMTGADGTHKITINPDHVESVQAANYDGKKATEIVLASGEKHYVDGDYSDVLTRLRSGR